MPPCTPGIDADLRLPAGLNQPCRHPLVVCCGDHAFGSNAPIIDEPTRSLETIRLECFHLAAGSLIGDDDARCGPVTSSALSVPCAPCRLTRPDRAAPTAIGMSSTDRGPEIRIRCPSFDVRCREGRRQLGDRHPPRPGRRRCGRSSWRSCSANRPGRRSPGARGPTGNCSPSSERSMSSVRSSPSDGRSTWP